MEIELIDFLTRDPESWLLLTWDHLKLVGMAVGVAIMTGVPIGIYISKNESIANIVLGISGMFMTIPSVALFGLFIPIFSLINQGIGFLPAFMALILYSLLPIIRNTYVSIKNVDANMQDAALGLGMTTREILFKIELPLALPVIMAGLRMSVVYAIGIGAIAAYIGAGGLGILISRGIAQSYTASVLAGAILLSILALSLDFILGRIQKVITPKGLRKQ